MPYRYPPEFRHRVLDLLATGRLVASLAEHLGVPSQTIYNWRRQDRIDRGPEPGPTSVEKADLGAACRRIAELETELAVTKRVIEMLKGKVVHRKRTVRGDPHDENWRIAYSGGLPGAGCVGVRVLCLAVPSSVGSLHPSCVAD